MKKLPFFAILIAVLSCDDGDFNTPSFSFETGTINACSAKVNDNGSDKSSILLYNLNGSEALILKLDENNTDDIFFKTALEDKSYVVSESGSNTLSYRIFNGSISKDYFCSSVPPTTPTVANEWLGNGTLVVNNVIVLDDNDNVSTAIEGITTDTDEDGYPNYIDTDDDGDNITTKNEDLDGDGDPTNDDTDNDGIPNYLDDDDDNDGILSKNESKTADANADTIVDYLDPTTTDSIDASVAATNNYEQRYTMSFVFTTLNLSSETDADINYESAFTFGSKTGTFTISDNPGETEN